MRDDVTISYRGASYEIGRGPAFYGIWSIGQTWSQPLEWWPDTPEGWYAAWTRFTTIERPETIAPVDQPTAPAAKADEQLASAGGQAAGGGGGPSYLRRSWRSASHAGSPGCSLTI